MSLPTKMSATKLLQKVRQLKKQYPDAIYDHDECYYFSGRVTNGPKTHGCIIGQAIRELYPENVAAIKKMEVGGGVGIDDLVTAFQTGKTLLKIQSSQDLGCKWGQCGNS